MVFGAQPLLAVCFRRCLALASVGAVREPPLQKQEQGNGGSTQPGVAELRKPFRAPTNPKLIGGDVGGGFFAYQEADFAEVLVDLAIGLEQGSFVVGDTPG